MKDLLLWTFLLGVAIGHPSQESAATTRRPNCIRMTPEKEAQIETIIEKLSNFLNNLTVEHEHFDIRLIKLAIEQHTPEEEEKETMLQLVVNDCQLSNEEVEEIENIKHEVNSTDTQVAAHDKEAEVATNKGELMYLDLDQKGQKLLNRLNKNTKKPMLIYLQQDKGQSSYWFLKK